MIRGFGKLPPITKRTLWDDLRWALGVLAGAVLGYLSFGAGDASLLLGSLVGAAVVVFILAVLRRLRRRRSA